MARYYLVLEDAMETYDADPMNYQQGIRNMLFCDDNGILESMEQYLRQAEEKAATKTAKERLRTVRDHYEYTLQFKRIFICDLKDVPRQEQKLKDQSSLLPSELIMPPLLNPLASKH